jgi:16S rRNA (uracil1498-N3)-methyltransferase
VSAPHFFVETLDGPTVLLSAEDSHHARRSLRLRPGEAVTVADGRGGWGEGRLAGDASGLAIVRLDRVTRLERPRAEVVVAMAPPKGDRLSWAVQKLAELGVDELELLEAERSVRRPGGAGLDRLRAVAREAAMQARLPFITRVGEHPGRVEDLPKEGSRVNVMLHPAWGRPLSEALPDRATGVRLLVGPEGGFSDDEVERAVHAGAALASLGSGILRTETAAIVGAALMLARYGRLGSSLGTVHG